MCASSTGTFQAAGAVPNHIPYRGAFGISGTVSHCSMQPAEKGWRLDPLPVLSLPHIALEHYQV